MAELSDTERGRQAAAILDSPLFKESWGVLKESYLMQLMACQPNDNEGRWRYAAALRGLATIQRHLEFVLKKGEITATTLKELEDITKREGVFKRAVRGFFSDDANAETPPNFLRGI